MRVGEAQRAPALGSTGLTAQVLESFFELLPLSLSHFGNLRLRIGQDGSGLLLGGLHLLCRLGLGGFDDVLPYVV